MKKMKKDTITKADLMAKVRMLEDDLIAMSEGIVNLENEMELLRKLYQESFNPYNSNPLMRDSLKRSADTSRTLHTDNSVNITIKR